MSNFNEPFISPAKKLPELTIKVIILGIILSILLAVSNTYLALKIGVLTSASIPAAIISMGILSLFKNSNVLENNLVQTAGSAGQAIAGGIVYTIPALIIIRYWTHFSYFENFIIALSSGILGVLFSIPFRKFLVRDKTLPFPEGIAIAEVLLASTKAAKRLSELILGGVLGAILELIQTGFKIAANNFQIWFSLKNTLFGFGIGFPAPLIGAGYLIGIELGLSLFIGAVIGWLVGIPTLSTLNNLPIQGEINQLVMNLWNDQIRFIGLGAMLVGTLLPLFFLFKLTFQGAIHLTLKQFNQVREKLVIRTEADISPKYVILGILLIDIILFFFLQRFTTFSLNSFAKIEFIICNLFFIAIFGLIISAMTGYFSGLLGVAAAPGSAIMVLILLTTAFVIKFGLFIFANLPKNTQLQMSITAIVIIISAIIGGIGAVAIDNIQDLKVGFILGATPWKQQIMLLIGIVCSALIIPLIMELLFQVYGIANVFPHANMDASLVLPAPPAALVAAVAQGLFFHHVPWHLMGVGAVIGFVFVVLSPFLKKWSNITLSPIGVAIGIYLPISSSTALTLGGIFSWLMKKKLLSLKQKQNWNHAKIQEREERGILLACGLVAGSALMNIILAIPFLILHNPNALSLLPAEMTGIKDGLGILCISLLYLIFYRVVCKNA